MVLKSSELLARCLENEGVEYVFQLPGEETLAVTDALSRSSVKLVTVRHEQAAAFMAGVYGRFTGRAGVCLATLRPGATNLASRWQPGHLCHNCEALRRDKTRDPGQRVDGEYEDS